MAISKITLNGVTQMDVTQKTVTANKMLNGITSLKNDGTDIEGDIPTKTSSNLTASGATVTAPAGYYASDASASVASGSATTPETTITSTPTINVNSNGLISINSSTQRTITPDVEAGYISQGTNGVVRVNISNTKQLDTQAAKTVTPTESEQTAVAANLYTTGAVKVGAISPNYIGSEVTQNDSDDLTVNGPTVTAPAGYYEEDASASVTSGTAGTPIATKGTVSNHSVTITPSVTNTTGYITGSTKTGAGVSVSASELVSGSENITHNGAFDVTNLASIMAAFPCKWEYETGYFTPSSDVTSYAITFSNTHYQLPFLACVMDVTDVYDATTYTAAYITYFNFQRLTGVRYRIAGSISTYGAVTARYRTTNTEAITQTVYSLYYSDTNTTASDRNYPRYWVRPDGMTADTGSNSVYFRTGKKYKWFAVWVPELNIPYEIGSVSGTNGSDISDVSIARTTEYIPVDPSVYIYLSNDAQVALRCYDANHTFMQETVSWLSSNFSLTTQVNQYADAANIAYVRFVAKYSDNHQIIDLQALANSIGIRGIV